MTEVSLDAGPVPVVAVVGRPNVGKSSLLNRLLGEDRVVVDSVAGTTRDPVDSLVEVGGETWRFVDTAGLRRRVSHASGAEYYSSLRTQGAIDAAEVVVVLLDASEPISEQDQRVIGMAVDAGRALVDIVEQSGGPAEVCERELEEEVLALEALLAKLVDLLVVGIARADRLLEDRRVRGQAGHRELADVSVERSARQQVTGDVVEPETLAGGAKGGGRVHAECPRYVVGPRERMSAITAIVRSGGGNSSWSVAWAYLPWQTWSVKSRSPSRSLAAARIRGLSSTRT